MRLKMRGTVSTLWAKTSGRDSNTSRSSVGLPEKSVARISTPVPGLSRVDLPHGLGVQPGALVGQVVARDAGDRGVAQPHLLHALGDPARLVGVVVGGLAGVDLAEVAAAGALRAADQEGRLAVFPALVDVGAAGLLAHGVQALVLDERVQRGVLGPHLRAGLDPLGLALDRRLRVAHLEAQELAPSGCGCRVDVGRGPVAQPLMRAPPAYSASNARDDRVDDVGGRDIRPHHLAHGRDAGIRDAAGDDAAEPGERVVAVDREAVHRDAALDAHADRGDLVLGQRPAHPDAAAALDAVAVDAVLASASISSRSRRRTWATTSTGSGRRTIG